MLGLADTEINTPGSAAAFENISELRNTRPWQQYASIYAGSRSSRLNKSPGHADRNEREFETTFQKRGMPSMVC